MLGAIVKPVEVKGKYPIVIFACGSFGENRNGNTNTVMNYLYQNLADMLAFCGIVTLRYDVASESLKLVIKSNQLVENLETAIKAAKELPFVDPAKVYVLGYESGSLLALKQKQSIAGLIMLGSLRYIYDAQAYDRFVRRSKGFMGFLVKLFNPSKRTTARSQRLIESMPLSKSMLKLCNEKESLLKEFAYPKLWLCGEGDMYADGTEEAQIIEGIDETLCEFASVTAWNVANRRKKSEKMKPTQKLVPYFKDFIK